MTRPVKPPRLIRWSNRVDKRKEWYIFYTDVHSGKKKRLKCIAHGANNDTQRKDLLRIYADISRHQNAEVLLAGGVVNFERRLLDAVEDFYKYTEEREKIGIQQAHSREGLKPASAIKLKHIINDFKAWLKLECPRLTTSQLDAAILGQYFRTLTGKLSVASVNGYKKNIKSCLRWLNSKRPKLFPDFDILSIALKEARVQKSNATALTPAQLVTFYKSLSGEQANLFLFYALTGCRAAEAFVLTWDDVDLNRGRISFYAPKTGFNRVLPLTGAPECEVSTGLLELMKRWKAQGLPPSGASDLSRPVWQRRKKSLGISALPQALRKNFTSYAASLGVPASVCAMWQGHTTKVAEEYYRQQVLERVKADCFEDAMGLGIVIKRALK